MKANNQKRRNKATRYEKEKKQSGKIERVEDAKLEGNENRVYLSLRQIKKGKKEIGRRKCDKREIEMGRMERGSKRFREGTRHGISKRRVLSVRNVARAGVCPSHVLTKHWRNDYLLRYAAKIFKTIILRLYKKKKPSVIIIVQEINNELISRTFHWK